MDKRNGKKIPPSAKKCDFVKEIESAEMDTNKFLSFVAKSVAVLETQGYSVEKLKQEYLLPQDKSTDHKLLPLNQFMDFLPNQKSDQAQSVGSKIEPAKKFQPKQKSDEIQDVSNDIDTIPIQINHLTQETLLDLKQILEPGSAEEFEEDWNTCEQEIYRNRVKSIQQDNKQMRTEVEELVTRVKYLEHCQAQNQYRDPRVEFSSLIQENAQLRSTMNQFQDRFLALERTNHLLSTKLNELDTRIYGLACGNAYLPENGKTEKPLNQKRHKNQNQSSQRPATNPSSSTSKSFAQNIVKPPTSTSANASGHQKNYNKSVAFSVQDLAKMGIPGSEINQSELKIIFQRLYLSTYTGPQSSKCNIVVKEGVVLNKRHEFLFAPGNCLDCLQKFKFRIRNAPTAETDPVLEIRSVS